MWALAVKDGRLPARSASVFGQPSSIRPELTEFTLALEACPGEEDLSVLTDSLSSSSAAVRGYANGRHLSRLIGNRTTAAGVWADY